MDLRSQFFEYVRETLNKHALEHLEAARSLLFYYFCIFFRRKRLTSIDLFEGL